MSGEVTIAGRNEITGHFTDNRAFATYAPNDPSLVQSLYKRMFPSRPSRRVGKHQWLMTLARQRVTASLPSSGSESFC